MPVIVKSLILFSTSKGIGDIAAENLSITIPSGTSEACLQLLAVDDEIVEVEEVFVITLKAGNVNDVVFGNVSVNILDNDGMCYHNH